VLVDEVRSGQVRPAHVGQVVVMSHESYMYVVASC
jgi:hypothetical protein